MSKEQETCTCSSNTSSDSRIRLQRKTLTQKWGSSKPIRCAGRERARGESIICFLCDLKFRGLLHGKDTKKKVFEATRAAGVEKKESGGLKLHGRTYFAVRHFSEFILPFRDCFLSRETRCRSKLPVSPPSLLPKNVLLLNRLATNWNANSEMC